MNSFTIFLFIHSWLRWVVLILAILVIFKSVSGWLGKKSFTSSDKRFSVLLIAFTHTQFLVGLILYFFLSPFGVNLFKQGMGAVMKDSYSRFWAVEHISMMFLGVVFIQLGRSLSKKAKVDWRKHQKLAIFTIIGLLLILSRIPWGEAARMFRTF